MTRPFALAPFTLLAALVCATLASGQSNLCSTATPIAGEGTFAFSNAGGTTSPNGTCGAMGSNVYFEWTPDETGAWALTTCGAADYDTVIAVFDGCAGSQLACNDDAGCGLQSTVTFGLTAGVQYIVAVGGYNSATGNGFLSTTFEADAPVCGGSVGPDVISADLLGLTRWGTVGEVTGYSIGSLVCNLGDEVLPWIGSNNHHPLMAQDIYRWKDGRFSQIGQSWIKHGFGVANSSACCPCQSPGGPALGIGCSDAYGSSTNGSQGILGPRSEVNGFTGVFSYPYTTQGQGGDAIYKRAQVRGGLLDPAQNAGARYFGQLHTIAPEDATAGNQNNNATWKEISVGSFESGGWNLSFTGPPHVTEPAIFAWQSAEPGVEITEVSVPGDGLFFVGSKVTDNGDGTWHYEYAVQNLNAQRGAQALSVPLAGATPIDVGFRDVDSHSGEIYSSDDWPWSVSGVDIEWASPTFAADPDANALRWGALYNFWFDAAAPPIAGEVHLELFLPGSPDGVSAAAEVPGEDCSPVTYCVTSPNSVGPGATIGTGGSSSALNNDLDLTVERAPGDMFGLFFYGPDPTQFAFGEGVQCIAPGATGIIRLNPPQMTNAQGRLTRALDLTQPPLDSGPGQVVPGSTWNFQFWYRDTAGGPSGFNLSDAVAVSFCP